MINIFSFSRLRISRCLSQFPYKCSWSLAIGSQYPFQFLLIVLCRRGFETCSVVSCWILFRHLGHITLLDSVFSVEKLSLLRAYGCSQCLLLYRLWCLIGRFSTYLLQCDQSNSWCFCLEIFMCICCINQRFSSIHLIFNKT